MKSSVWQAVGPALAGAALALGLSWLLGWRPAESGNPLPRHFTELAILAGTVFLVALGVARWRAGQRPPPPGDASGAHDTQPDPGAAASASRSVPGVGTAASASPSAPVAGTAAPASPSVPGPGTAAPASPSVPGPGTAASASPSVPDPGTPAPAASALSPAATAGAGAEPVELDGATARARAALEADPAGAVRLLRAWLDADQRAGDDMHAAGAGAARVAALIERLDEPMAAQLLRNLAPREVEAVAAALTAPMDTAVADAALQAFTAAMASGGRRAAAPEPRLRGLLQQALGPERAERVLDRLLLGAESRGLESLKWMDARGVHDVIGEEHPQLIALVLACLDPAHSAAVLALFPETQRPELLMRVAALDGVQPEALRELNALLERRLQDAPAPRSAGVGGARVAAGILERLDAGVERAILDTVGERNPALAQRIQGFMVVFDDLYTLDDQALQALLRELTLEQLTLALRLAEQRMHDRVFALLPASAAARLRASLDRREAVRLSEVELAQKSILAVARRLSVAGSGPRGAPGEGPGRFTPVS